jgi:hypothetical protein
MSKKPVRLENVLTRKEKATLELAFINADELKRIARFWFGPTVSNKMRKAECLTALDGVFKDRKQVDEGIRSLSDQERQILSIFKRYGGALSGPLLTCEALQRGLCEERLERGGSYGKTKTNDPVEQLGDKLFLVTPGGHAYSSRSYYSYGYKRSYPDLVLQPIVGDLIKPADPLPWASSTSASVPTTAQRRSTAQVALDLWGIAQALAQSGAWMTNRGGSLAKSVQNRLKKIMPSGERDPMTPPAAESLYYEILRGLGAVDADTEGGTINLAAVESSLAHTAVVQSWHWARAWIHARLWQDGIGVVPDRNKREESARIEPAEMLHAREVLVWALCRVAHGSNDWLDLETFLGDLWSVTGEDTISFCWHEFAWRPNFASAKAKEHITGDKARRRAYWLDREGIWASNAIMGTLFCLGLVERGQGGSGAKERYCFRLTDVGMAAFGSPESPLVESAHDPHFLIIQPNHEVIAYLDAADASAVWPLAQMARRDSSTAGLVQTFTLTRDSIYQALESGLQLGDIQRFLTEHSKTGLPANVAHSLNEWGKRRESLVLRARVSLGISTSEADKTFLGFANARQIGDKFVLLPASAGRGQKIRLVLNHDDLPKRIWRVDEEGTVMMTGAADSVTLARLSQFADPAEQNWHITAASIRRARERGIPAEQILGWLGEHLIDALPAIMETAIRNWSSPARAFLGNLVMLQIAQPQAIAAILASQRLRHFLLDHVPPNWFIVHAEHRVELEQALTELGFSLNKLYQGTPMSESREKTGQDSAAIGARRRSRKNEK